VINRELRGEKDITVGRIGELAFALGRKPLFTLPEKKAVAGVNRPPNLPSVGTKPLNADTTNVPGRNVQAAPVVVAA
jgi:hypothetical protein